MLAQEVFHPLWGLGSTTDLGPSISHVQKALEASPLSILVLLAVTGAAEAWNIARGWDLSSDQPGALITYATTTTTTYHLQLVEVMVID